MDIQIRLDEGGAFTAPPNAPIGAGAVKNANSPIYCTPRPYWGNRGAVDNV